MIYNFNYEQEIAQLRAEVAALKNSINILKGEQALGIDSIMIPTQTSHTLTNEDGGRKEKADDPTKSDKQSKNPEQ